MTSAPSELAAPVRLWRHVVRWMTGEPVLAILLTAFIVLEALRPQTPPTLFGLVDWPTIVTLAGLLMLTKAIEFSGALDWLARRLLQRIHTQRGLACLLVLLAAGLATLLTNDVALFAVVPLALSLHRLTPLPIKRLVIAIALAVNAGSVLTPLGNPQNLFLWQSSGVSFLAFTWALAPLAGVLMLMLVVLTLFLFPPAVFAVPTGRDSPAHPAVDIRLICVTGLAFVAFVVLADLRHELIAWLLVLTGYGLWRREAVLRIDWLLLLIFVLMFIVLRSVAALPAIHGLLAAIDLRAPLRVYLAAALLSQGISNVPATILLAEFTPNWHALAYGVSVGGFGIGIGSLANLIAIRLAGERGIWGPFHAISLPFFALATGAGAGLLFCLGQWN
jgi:Na+/H+ antiporter NhaD/arsenite permease-like protein